ncbi:autotransporter [Opitutaceae bacterium TAV5]|nr:autotransporter [Opitutaceae bacterium TAV5]
MKYSHLTAAVLVTGLSCGFLNAQTTLNWSGGSGGGNANMSGTGNWTEGISPGADTDLVIATRNGSGTIPTLLTGADYTIRSISFDNAAGRYGPDGLRIGPTTASSASTRTLTFGTADITIISATNEATVTFWRYNTSSTLTINLGYTGYGGINIDSTSSVTFSTASITGTGGIEKTGTGTLVLGTTNTFTGGLTISEGVVSIDNAANLGSTASVNTNGVIINGGTLQVTGGTTASFANRGWRVGAQGGTLEVAEDVTFRILGSMRNVSGEDGVLVKTGAGTLSLENTSTGTSGYAHTGGTVVSAGTLLLNAGVTLGRDEGAGVTVASGATLAGSGTVAGDSVLADGAIVDIGTYSAGVLSDAIGTLAFTGNLSVGDASFFFDLATTGASDLVQLAAGAVLDIGSGVFDLDNLQLTALAGFDDGIYTLFSTSETIVGTLGDTLTGTLDGRDVVLALGSNGTSLVLRVGAIPEPATFAALAGLALFGLAFFLRRHPARRS